MQKPLLFLPTTSLHLHHSKPASINDSWTADKAARSGSISEMVCWTSSLVSRSHSLRIVDLSKSWKPSRTEHPRSRSSKMFAITSQRSFWQQKARLATGWMFCREMDGDTYAPCFSLTGFVLLSAALLWHQRIGVREKINHKYNIKKGKSTTIQLAILVCSYVLQKGILILQPPALSIQ